MLHVNLHGILDDQGKKTLYKKYLGNNWRNVNIDYILDDSY